TDSAQADRQRRGHASGADRGQGDPSQAAQDLVQTRGRARGRIAGLRRARSPRGSKPAVRSADLLCERGRSGSAAPAPTGPLRGSTMTDAGRGADLAPPAGLGVGLGARLERFWFVPAPGLRLAVVRVLICAYALIWLIAGAPILLSALWFPADRF